MHNQLSKPNKTNPYMLALLLASARCYNSHHCFDREQAFEQT